MTSEPAPVRDVLVIARTSDDAELASSFIDGDATIDVGEDRSSDRASARTVVVAGDLSDPSWVEHAFTHAGERLAPGGRVLLVLARDLGDARSFPNALPTGVVEQWRFVGFRAESVAVAALFQQAADADGAEETQHRMRLLQLNLLLAGRPDLLDRLGDELGTSDSAWIIRPEFDPDRDAEILELRQKLDSYRFSPLGRLTTLWRSLRSGR